MQVSPELVRLCMWPLFVYNPSLYTGRNRPREVISCAQDEPVTEGGDRTLPSLPQHTVSFSHLLCLPQSQNISLYPAMLDGIVR